MKTWDKPKAVIQIEREIPMTQPNFLAFECIFGSHKAELLHKGTAYCRTHYDQKNMLGELIN